MQSVVARKPPECGKVRFMEYGESRYDRPAQNKVKLDTVHGKIIKNRVSDVHW